MIAETPAWRCQPAARESRRRASFGLLLAFVIILAAALGFKAGALTAVASIVALLALYGCILWISANGQRRAQARARDSGYLTWPAQIPAGYVPDARLRGRSDRLRPDAQIQGRFVIAADGSYRWIPTKTAAKSFGCGEIRWGPDWIFAAERVFGLPPQAHVVLKSGGSRVDLWLRWTSDLPSAAFSAWQT